ncbi:MAG: hypothetical protein K2W82_03460 [Candidatus Obscuribacterales bacterium]|nr:hypothetical protein [Candidatus Obscuribacterales bacterium]
MVIEAKNDTKLEMAKKTSDKDERGIFDDLLGSNAEYWQARKQMQAPGLPEDHLILAFAPEAVAAAESPLVTLQKELTELESKQDGVNSNSYGDCLFKIGVEQLRSGDKVEAHKSLVKAIESWRHFPGQHSSEYGDRLIDFAKECSPHDEIPWAEAALREALVVQEQEFGKYHGKTADVLERLSAMVGANPARAAEASNLSVEARYRLKYAPVPNDGMQRILRSVAQLPENIQADINQDGISLQTSNLPRLLEESTGVNLKQLLTVALAQNSNIPESSRSQLSEGIYRALRGISGLENHGNQVKLTRHEETRIPLPNELTEGYIDGIAFDKEISFKLESPSPESIVISDLHGITFTRDDTKVNLTSISFTLANNKLAVKTDFELAEDKQQQAPATDVSVFDIGAISNLGKNYFLTKIIKNLPEIKIDVDGAACKAGLQEFHKFKELLSSPQEAKHLLESSTGVSINDPFSKAMIEGGTRITKKGGLITLERKGQTVCDLGGVSLRIDPKVVIQTAEEPANLIINRIEGINLDVPFSAPEELKRIGLDLDRSVPKQITGLMLFAPNFAGNRFLRADTGAQTHMQLTLSPSFQPARDTAGNWILRGAVGSPIDGQPVPFWVRLNGQNQPEMSFDELAVQGIHIATKAVRFDSPSTWKWGAAAVAGEVVRDSANFVNWLTD